MKVSLIVPAFNEEKYIGLLLDSVISQSVRPDEIIVCDNNSTDRTIEVIRKYRSKLPVKIVVEKQKGIRYTVEKAWRSTTGDLILRTDADCILPTNWVENYISLFQNHPSLAAAGSGFKASDGNYFAKLFTPFLSEANRFVLYLVKNHQVLYGANFAIRRSVLLNIGGYATDIPIVQDDVLISKKLHQAGYSYRYLSNNWNYTSTRRFNHFKNVVLVAFSIFKDKFYFEKSI